MKKIILIIIALLVVGKMGYNDELVEQSYYCEMVKTYKQTNGQHGWPDYKGIYNNECK